MDLQSVNSSINTYANTTAQANQTQQVQPAEEREPKAAERVESKDEAPRPVKNAQGQETGTLINVIA